MTQPQGGDLDAFLDELIDRVDECEGTHFRGDSGIGIWFHTPQQIVAWITDAQEAWAEGNYRTDEVEP